MRISILGVLMRPCCFSIHCPVPAIPARTFFYCEAWLIPGRDDVRMQPDPCDISSVRVRVWLKASRNSMDALLNSVQSLLQRVVRRNDLVLATLIVCIIFMMILPLPTWLIDGLIALNMCLS